ncbi:MAG: carboxypeptidase-like regulatory domain-containing protein [Bacteroidetes bacterium]|nr:carboxypeptidase-like regulatory domain-containing protein [Bacteroidota bacterium]
MRRITVLIALICCVWSVQGQITTIRGRIYAEETREPLAFANLYFGSTDYGFYSDFEGNFFYTTDSLKSDTLKCTYLGYLVNYVTLKKGESNVLEIEMKREIVQTGTVEIKLKYNPALKWIALAQDKRKENSPANLQQYECENFTKNIIALNNINEKLRRGKFGKELGSMFDTISYISGDKSKSILPVFISEVISDYYFNRNPFLTKEVIRASRLKGIGVQDGTFLSQLLGSSFVSYNFYDNTQVVIDKGILSPIAESAMAIYNYQLVNVDKSGPRRVFQIYCEPKNSKDLAFHGFVWIEDTTGALLRLSLELNNQSNINFLEKLRITQEYSRTESGAYFCVNTRAVVDAAELSTNAVGVVATITVTAKKVNTTTVHPPKFYESRVTMAPDATTKPDSFWNSNRHLAMNAAEARILSKIDTLLQMPRIRTYTDLANFLVDGYRNFGKIDLGPYYSLVSFNQLEGPRVRLGFRTSYKFSHKWHFEGFAAYGFWDQKWKYSLDAEYMLKRMRWRKIGLIYRRDVDQIGMTDNDNYATGLFTTFNLLGSNYVNLNRDFRMYFGTDLRNGLRVSLTAGNRYYQFTRVNSFNFAWYPVLPDTSVYSTNFTNSTLTLSIRYAPRYYFLANDYRRVTFSGIGPEYYGTVIQGVPGILNSQFRYTRIIAGINYNKVWGAVGRTMFNLEGSRVFGVLPYPLLTVYIGNQSFVYNPGAYNQMRIFEFITDRSVSGSIEHHLNGYLFNRVPLLRKLKWREIFATKAIYGTLAQKNFDIIPRNINTGSEYEPISQFKTFSTLPYWEVSAGIENILKILRVDAVWRLTYRNEPRVRNFGVKASIGLAF